MASRPALTTNREAMNSTAGSPKPASAWPRSSTPVAQSASDVAIATTTTGSRSQTNRTTIAATIAKVSVMSLKIWSPAVAAFPRYLDQPSCLDLPGRPIASPSQGGNW